MYENGQKGSTHRKTNAQKDERAFFNQIAERIFPEVQHKLKSEVEGLVRYSDEVKTTLAKDMRGVLYMAKKHDFENSIHMSNIKQLQFNYLRKRDDYGHHIAELTNALQRTKDVKHFDYDHYFRFKDREADMYYNHLIGDDEFKEPKRTNFGFEEILETNELRLRGLYSKVQPPLDQRGDLIDSLDKYMSNYRTKNEAFENYLRC